MRKAHLNIGAALTVYMGLAFYASMTHAITLSQEPLFLTSGAEANIMFVLDDSGSMRFEVMPESYRISDAVNVFPSNGVTNFNARVAAPASLTIDGVSAVNGKLLRSKNNAVYYDPSKLYTPWVSIDGITLMPNANPKCALHNPMVSGTGESNCRDLTVEEDRVFNSVNSTWVVCSSASNCKTSTDGTIKLYPATYYYFTGAANEVWDTNKYEEVKIQGTTSRYSGHGRNSGKRTDCDIIGNVTQCSYAQEMQNFANWYTYYRSRVLTARAGIGRAFSEQQDGIRVGFGTINRTSNKVDGIDTDVIKTGVRKFDNARKVSFLKELYEVPIGGGTPLPFALRTVGEYFQRDDNNGPWAKDPGNADASAHVACRASYAMLLSDGYWTSTVSNIGNSDGTDGAAIINDTPGDSFGTTYQYKPSAPFSDKQPNSLADVAMAFWKKDLREDLANRVKPNKVDLAFWQHMTTFTIGLGVEGKMSPTPNVAESIAKSTPIAWPTLVTSAEDGTKVDDMVHAAINGRGDFFSAREPDDFSERLSSMLRDIDGRTRNNAAAAAANSTSLTSGSIVYRASFDSKEWYGRLIAKPISTNGTYGKEIWEATFPSASERDIFTYDAVGAVGKPFIWANLTAAQKLAISGTDSEAIGESRFNWVRGVDFDKANTAADLRARTSLLGDIVNSSPVYAGRENMGFNRLSTTLGGPSYTEYYNNRKKNRREVIYVGANDGMLHAFDATVGTTESPDTKTDGEEVFAYIPSSMLSGFKKLSSLSYGKNNTNPHRYMVDGQIFVSDAYVGGRWRNLLVGALGAGGRGIYVLDVTDPDNFSASNVLFELTEADYPELGNIVGTPFIAPGKDGRWKIYLGNGYNSSQGGVAKGYLGIIDIQDEMGTGTSRTKFIETDGVAGNGLAQPALLPAPDGTIVGAYAGDLRGNLWKYDLKGATPATWVRAFGNTPLFVAMKGSVRQPITASPTLGFNTELSPARVMVYFGTGRYLASFDNQVSADEQSFYAIADKEEVVASRTSLHQKTIASSSTAAKRVIDGEVTSAGENAVPWSTVSGWYLDFPANERIIVKPQLYYDRLIFPTIIPSEDPCSAGGTTWVMELIAVGNTDLDYRVLGTQGNVFEDVLILSPPTMLIGTKQRENSSEQSNNSSSSSSSEGQCGSGTMINVMTDINDESQDKQGVRPCPLFNRQSWRELEN